VLTIIIHHSIISGLVLVTLNRIANFCLEQYQLQINYIGTQTFAEFLFFVCMQRTSDFPWCEIEMFFIY